MCPAWNDLGRFNRFKWDHRWSKEKRCADQYDADNFTKVHFRPQAWLSAIASIVQSSVISKAHQPFACVAGFAWYGIGIQYNKPHVQASGVVSWRLSRKLATSAERTIDPAQPMTTHGHTGVCECPTGQGGVLIGM